MAQSMSQKNGNFLLTSVANARNAAIPPTPPSAFAQYEPSPKAEWASNRGAPIAINVQKKKRRENKNALVPSRKAILQVESSFWRITKSTYTTIKSQREAITLNSNLS